MSLRDDDHPTLEHLDRDGALGELLEGVYGESRAAFLRKAALGSAAMLAAVAAPVPSRAAAATQPSDKAILRYALRFEQLQAAFYTEADRAGIIDEMPVEKRRWARTVGAHERAHVDVLKEVLGRDTPKGSPSFNFRGVTESEDKFTRTAVAFEDLTVSLLTGAVPRFEDPALTAAFFGVLTTEARHASWIRQLVGVTPVLEALDEPKSLSEVSRFVSGTRFVSARATTSRRRRRPRFTG